jgi:hypothetical protein
MKLYMATRLNIREPIAVISLVRRRYPFVIVGAFRASLLIALDS